MCCSGGKDITSKIMVQPDFFKNIVLSVLITQDDLNINFPKHITFAVWELWQPTISNSILLI